MPVTATSLPGAAPSPIPAAPPTPRPQKPADPFPQRWTSADLGTMFVGRRDGRPDQPEVMALPLTTSPKAAYRALGTSLEDAVRAIAKESYGEFGVGQATWGVLHAAGSPQYYGVRLAVEQDDTVYTAPTFERLVGREVTGTSAGDLKAIVSGYRWINPPAEQDAS